MAGSNRAERDGTGANSGRSGFVRLTELLAGIEPGKPPINLSVGEPHHPLPGFVGPALLKHLEDFGRYPMTRGIEPFRRAVAGWLGRRYALPRPVDPEREVLVLAGSREGLFLAAIAARRYARSRDERPAVLLPNPFYMAYFAGARAAGCEPIALPATRETGFLPNYDAVSDTLLQRTAAIYLCSPANPQGAVLSREALARIVERARAAGAMIFADECYSEIWLGDSAPAGVLEVAGKDFDGVVAFNSLSKRSSLPGLRCGFAAGDADFLAAFLEFRNVAAPRFPCRRSMSPSRPMATKRMSRKIAASIAPSSILPTEFLARDIIIAAPMAAFFSGSILRATTKPPHANSGVEAVFASCPAAISAIPMPTAPTRARAMSVPPLSTISTRPNGRCAAWPNTELYRTLRKRQPCE
jgi:histidinol-phosphate/aromatic aminotransferase/cobyric acid decarboxylase-like protein